MAPQLSSYDGILPHVGEFGFYQFAATAILCTASIPGVFPTLLMYFSALSPDWRCVANSTSCIWNGSLPSGNEARCNISRSEWEYTEPTEYSIVTEFDIYCTSANWIIPFTSSILFIGWMIGAPVLGWISDNYGRKKVLIPSFCTITIVGFIMAFSPNIYMFIICRFIVGFCVPGCGTTLFVILNEMVNTRFRATVGNVFWMLFVTGLCLMGMIAYLIPRWKLIIIICSIPWIIFVIPLWFFTDESVRWQLSAGKVDEATKTVKIMATRNKRPFPEDYVLEADVKKTAVKSTIIEVFRGRKMAISTCIQAYGWLICGMAYYGISLAADDLGGSLYVNYILTSLVELPGLIVAIIGCDKIGRKKTAWISCLIASVACLLVAAVPQDEQYNPARVFLGVFGKFAISITFSAIYTWSVELYPTNLRANGMAVMQIFSRIGSASSPFVAKALLPVHYSLPFVVMGALPFVASILFLYLPETKAPNVVTGEAQSPDHSEEKAGKNGMVQNGQDIELNTVA